VSINRHIIAGVVVVSAVVAALVVVSLRTTEQRGHRVASATSEAQRSLQTIETSPAVVESTPQLVAAPTTTAPSAWTRPTPPSALAAWFSVTESERLALIEQLHPDPRLTPEVVAFFTAEIRDRALGDVTRNHVANLLLRQEANNPALAEVFRAMAEDRSEDYLWREYSVQHWASATDFSADPERQMAGLWRLAETGEESIPGTVLLHLSYLDERGVRGVPVGFDARVKTLIADPNANVLTRMTCIGLVADRRMMEAVPLVRDLARSAPQPSVQRCALAALGTLGDVADLSIVQGFTSDQDASIAAAAKGAEKRLLVAQQISSSVKP
jgi:HEAT repeat protein